MVRVLDSLSTSNAAVTVATGPEVKNIIAACGRYVKKNMKEVTPAPRVRVGVSLCIIGDQRLR